MTPAVGEDVVVKILLNLPRKSLMRFKCVSKWWYSLINDPWFIAKHRSHFNSKNPNLRHLLVMKNFYEGLNDDDVCFFEGLEFSRFHKLDEQVIEQGGEQEVVFSVLNLCDNGDDVVESGEDRIIVSSKEDIKLPPSMRTLLNRCRGKGRGDDIKLPPSMRMSLFRCRGKGELVHMVAHCNGIICLLVRDEVILWNPAIQDFKLLPPSPYLGHPGWWFVDDHQGFGFDANLNQHIFVGFYSDYELDFGEDGYTSHKRPRAAIYSLGTDSWKTINTNSLETELTFFWPNNFEIQFKEMFYWFEDERHKDLELWILEDSTVTDLVIRRVIIALDIQNEVFYDILFPDCLYERLYPQDWALRVWNESLSLFALVYEYSVGVNCNQLPIVIWVMDELGGPTGASWTKLVTLEFADNPLHFGFLNSDDIILERFMGIVCSYDLLGSKITEEEIFRQNSPYTDMPPRYDSLSAVAYVKSIVTVSGPNKVEIRDNSSVANLSPLPYIPSNPSTVDWEFHSNSVWAIPPYDVSVRIKKVMESLRTEFGGPEIKPHIPFVSHIRMTYEDVLAKFRSLSSKNFHSFEVKINLLDTSDFYYQCISLQIHMPEASSQFDYTLRESASVFYSWTGGRQRLSLLYGNLTEEEKRVAVEKVRILDESISSLSFTITQLALYKINYRDTTLKSWERIAEYNLQLP